MTRVDWQHAGLGGIIFYAALLVCLLTRTHCPPICLQGMLQQDTRDGCTSLLMRVNPEARLLPLPASMRRQGVAWPVLQGGMQPDLRGNTQIGPTGKNAGGQQGGVQPELQLQQYQDAETQQGCSRLQQQHKEVEQEQGQQAAKQQQHGQQQPDSLLQQGLLQAEQQPNFHKQQGNMQPLQAQGSLQQLEQEERQCQGAWQPQGDRRWARIMPASLIVGSPAVGQGSNRTPIQTPGQVPPTSLSAGPPASTAGVRGSIPAPARKPWQPHGSPGLKLAGQALPRAISQPSQPPPLPPSHPLSPSPNLQLNPQPTPQPTLQPTPLPPAYPGRALGLDGGQAGAGEGGVVGAGAPAGRQGDQGPSRIPVIRSHPIVLSPPAQLKSHEPLTPYTIPQSTPQQTPQPTLQFTPQTHSTRPQLTFPTPFLPLSSSNPAPHSNPLSTCSHEEPGTSSPTYHRANSRTGRICTCGRFNQTQTRT